MEMTLHFDDQKVCSSCLTNDAIHYNLVVFPARGRAEDDPDCPVWCSNCECEAVMIEDPGPQRRKPNESL